MSPGIGTRYAPEDAALAELRFFPTTRFKNDLIFYRLAKDGIEKLFAYCTAQRYCRHPG